MPIQVADAYRNSAYAQKQTGLLFNLPPPDPGHEQLPEGISLCMIVKNEERFLAECLESVKGVVDEINIVDTGSTDRTVEIARSYGANVEFREWRNDFAWARNEALGMATKRWTLILDADEEIERESLPFLQALRTTPAGFAAVYMSIVNIIDDPSGVGTMSHRLIRVIPTNPVLRYFGVIHESVSRTDGEDLYALLSPITILHKGYTVEMLRSREKDARNKPLINRAYEENTDDSFSLFNFGNSAICSGDTDLGIQVLEDLLARFESPKLYFPLAYLMLAQTYCETLGDNDKALDAVERGIERFPRDAGLIFVKGQILSKMRQYDEARELFEKTMSLREYMAFSVMTDEEIFEWKVYYAYAGTYEKEKNWDLALEYMDKAISNKPGSYNLHKTKAAFLEAAERFYDAEIAYRELSKTHSRGQVELVNYLLRRRRFAQAIAIVENEIDSGMNSDMVALLNVAAARAMTETKQADPLIYLEAALRVAPAHGVAIKLMESLLMERGDTTRLERLHREELLAPCKWPDDFARRSYRLLALGQNEDAQSTADRGLQIDPNHAELRFNTALAALRLGDDAQALRELKRIAAKSADVYFEAAKLRASLHLKGGERSEALAALRDGLAASPISAEAVLSSTGLLLAAAARAEARSLLEEYLGVDQRIALELATVLLQDGDIAGAGRVAAASLT